MAKNKFLERKINCLSFDEWINQNSSQVEREYEILKNEYGDALTCLLSDYKEQKYREYLNDFFSTF